MQGREAGVSTTCRGGSRPPVRARGACWCLRSPTAGQSLVVWLEEQGVEGSALGLGIVDKES